MVMLKKSEYFESYFDLIHKKLDSIHHEQLMRLAELIVKVHEADKKIIIAGNGGSAAMASHVAVDLTKAAGIRAITFNEADLLTCFANDYGYERWVAKALEFYGDEGDLAILISSSGSSPNMINGANQARIMDMPVVTLSGFSADNPLRELGDINLWVESSAYNIVEMTHHIWLVAVIDYIIQMQENA